MATAVPQQPYASIRRRILSYCAEVFLLLVGVLLLQGILFALRLNPLVRGVQSGAYSQRGLSSVAAGDGRPAAGSLLRRDAGVVCAGNARDAPAGAAAGTRGRRPHRYGQAILRSLVMLIPFEVNHTFLAWASTPQGVPTRLALQYAAVGILVFLYIFAAARSQRRQSIHDRVAGTVVVSTRNPK